MLLILAIVIAKGARLERVITDFHTPYAAQEATRSTFVGDVQLVAHIEVKSKHTQG